MISHYYITPKLIALDSQIVSPVTDTLKQISHFMPY